jgi:hypothetical protein
MTFLRLAFNMIPLVLLHDTFTRLLSIENRSRPILGVSRDFTLRLSIYLIGDLGVERGQDGYA